MYGLLFFNSDRTCLNLSNRDSLFLRRFVSRGESHAKAKGDYSNAHTKKKQKMKRKEKQASDSDPFLSSSPFTFEPEEEKNERMERASSAFRVPRFEPRFRPFVRAQGFPSPLLRQFRSPKNQSMTMMVVYDGGSSGGGGGKLQSYKRAHRFGETIPALARRALGSAGPCGSPINCLNFRRRRHHLFIVTIEIPLPSNKQVKFSTLNVDEDDVTRCFKLLR